MSVSKSEVILEVSHAVVKCESSNIDRSQGGPPGAQAGAQHQAVKAVKAGAKHQARPKGEGVKAGAKHQAESVPKGILELVQRTSFSS